MSFGRYVRIVGRCAFSELSWFRDLVIATIIAVTTAALQLVFHFVTKEQRWQLLISVIAPYIVVLGLYILLRTIQAPWKLHNEIVAEKLKLIVEERALQQELEREREKISPPFFGGDYAI